MVPIRVVVFSEPLIWFRGPSRTLLELLLRAGHGHVHLVHFVVHALGTRKPPTLTGLH